MQSVVVFSIFSSYYYYICLAAFSHNNLGNPAPEK